MKKTEIVTGSQTVTDDDHAIFQLVGADTVLSLFNNKGSRIFMDSPSQHLNLSGDANERIFINGSSNDGISANGLLSGITRIFGFSHPQEFFVLARTSVTPGLAPSDIQTDHHGGTLVTLQNGARIDFIDDPHVGVVGTALDATFILGNILIA
jgi:hypothetical protein